jgi:hypothetical protein
MQLSLIVSAALFLSFTSIDAAPPTVPIDQALKLAMDDLATRSLAGEHYIGSLTLESSSMLSGGQQYWYARWVPAIRTDKKFENGLRINMDGSVVRLVSGNASGGRNDAPGVRPIGARNIR